MIRLFIIGLLFTMVHSNVVAQYSIERSALRSLNKQRWERAHEQLKKASSKDSASAITKYIYARYFFSPENPHYNIDSAHRYTTQTLLNLTHANARQRDQIKRFPLDSIIVLKLNAQIDSTAFERARFQNTEKDYVYFLSSFPYARQRSQAFELRDEAAYQEALKQNTYQSFALFLQKYPLAKQAAMSQERYDKLLFQQKTRDKRLRSYENFLIEHPATPYRIEVEKNIFEITTATGDVQSFEWFIKKYPESFFIYKAKEILRHILLEDDSLELPAWLLNDSTQKIQTLNQTYLVPFLKNEKYSFMNDEGVDIIQTETSEIDKQYLCGNITADILVLPDGIITKSNKVIFKGIVEDVDDLGHGFLKVIAHDTITVLHKSGFIIHESHLQDVKIINGKFIALQHENQWGLWTLTGRKLMHYEWDNIATIGQIIVFKRFGKYNLATMHQVALLADQRGFKVLDFFDEVKSLPHNDIWVRSDDYEGILDQNLDYRVSFEKHQLTSIPQGIIVSDNSGKKIYNTKGQVSEVFENIKANEKWIAVKNDAWRFFNPEVRAFMSAAFDSVSFIGPFAIGHSTDTLTVFLNDHIYYTFSNASLEFIPGKDSTTFLQVNERDKKTLYNASGIKLFTATYDKIIYAGNGIFIVSKKEKKGLANTEGRILLPIEYDAIGGLNNKTISILKNKKFGLYHIIQKKIIKPQYDKNINPYNEKLLIGFKDGFYGFINWSTKPVSKFIFEDVIYWNDTAALVKSNSQWMLYDIINQKIFLDNIKDYKLVSDINNERIFIIHQQGLCGVVSTTKGIIIPISFTDIKNLGSPEKPLYFTEKHVEEASIFVVIYYNKEGKLLKRQVFEDDEYEKIYCSN